MFWSGAVGMFFRSNETRHFAPGIVSVGGDLDMSALEKVPLQDSSSPTRMWLTTASPLAKAKSTMLVFIFNQELGNGYLPWLFLFGVDERPGNQRFMYSTVAPESSLRGFHTPWRLFQNLERAGRILASNLK